MQLGVEPTGIGSPTRRESPHDDAIRRTQLTEDIARRMPQTPSHPVPNHRAPNGFGHNEPHLRPYAVRRRRAARVHHDIRLRRSHAVSNGVTELRRASHPVLSREHWSATARQAVSERRPLRRRPVTMARPARVRMRSRKPWTLARRRLFGWKVRLPLATTVSPRHFWQPRSLDDLCITGARAAVAKALLEPARARSPGRCRATDVWATVRGY